MGYTKTNFLTGDTITAARLAVMETQYDQALADIPPAAQSFRGLHLRTAEDGLAAKKVTLIHADEIVCSNGARRAPADGLSADITVAGIGGLRASQSEAASTWYKILYGYGGSGEGLWLEQAKDYYNDQSAETYYTITTLRGATSTLYGVGQTFTAGTSGKLEFIDVAVWKVGSPTGNIWLELKAADGSYLPTGSVLATSHSFNIGNMTTAVNWYRFVFRTPATVTSGQKYSFYVAGDYTLSDATMVRAGKAQDVTTGRFISATGAGPATWTADATYELMHRIYITRNDNAVAPPSGYDTGYAHVGWVRNNASSNFDPFCIAGRRYQQIGVAGSWNEPGYSSTTYTDTLLASCANVLPPALVRAWGMGAVTTVTGIGYSCLYVAGVPHGMVANRVGWELQLRSVNQSLLFPGVGPVSTEFQAMYLSADQEATARGSFYVTSWEW